MKLGDKVMRLPETFTDSPKGYYHTVEFELNGGHVRESFKGVSD